MAQKFPTMMFRCHFVCSLAKYDGQPKKVQLGHSVFIHWHLKNYKP